MDKRAENTFVAGLNTDRHPLTSQKTELIDAQNIDLLAIGEGYQLILQKREGNVELLLLPPAWNTLYSYKTNEYVTYGGVTYKSLIDSNKGIIPVNGSSWQLQSTLLVPAGLRPGFIPLSVKEFNNIAYIISVDPTSLDPITHLPYGEIGTFPSPDYSKFLYVQGPSIVPSPIIQPGYYDPRRNIPIYEYNIVPVVGSGTNEVVEFLINDVASPQLLYKAGFRIFNTGLLDDRFDITTNLANANIVSRSATVPFSYGFGVVFVPTGEFRDISFEVQRPFIAYWNANNNYSVGMYATDDGITMYRCIVLNTGAVLSNATFWTSLGSMSDYLPDILRDTTLTITSVGLPTNTSSYNFRYHIPPTFAATYAPEILYRFGSIGDSLAAHRVAYAGGSVQFKWLSNEQTMTTQITLPLITSPVNSGSSATEFTDRTIGITFGSNSASVICHTVDFYLLGTCASGTAIMNIYAEQYAINTP